MDPFRVRAEYLFLIFAAVFGAMFCILTPPLAIPDEHVHFFRAVAVARGDLFEAPLSTGALGNLLPRSVQTVGTRFGNVSDHYPTVRDANALLEAPLNPANTVEVPFPQAASYSPIAYAVQATGIFAAGLTDGSALFMMYAARVANLLFWSALVFIAIRRLPRRLKLLAMVVALTPMALSQAASVSPDAMNNALSFYVIACCVAWMCLENGRVISPGDMLLYLLASVLLVFCKMNASCAFLVVFIPSARFGGRLRKLAFVVVLGSIILLSFYTWARYIAQPLPAGRIGRAGWLRQSPLEFIGLLIHTTNIMLRTYIEEYIGIFGYRNFRMAEHAYHIYILALALALTTTRSNPGWLVRVASVGLLAAIYVTYHALLYVAWSPDDATLIMGVQGRYFLPFAALLLVFPGRGLHRFSDVIRIRPNVRFVRALIVACCLAVFVFSAIQVLHMWTPSQRESKTAELRQPDVDEFAYTEDQSRQELQ